jgi:nucleoid-associated protein YgaU
MSGNKTQSTFGDKADRTTPARARDHSAGRGSALANLQRVLGNQALCAATKPQNASGLQLLAALGSRVHSDSTTDRYLQTLGARAITSGPDVYLHTNVARTPNAPRNARILAHEAVHRQQHARWAAGIPASNTPALEHEAREGSLALTRGQAFQAQRGAPPHVPLYAKPEEETDDVANKRLATYWVRPGDTLSKIAKRGTGDPMRYVEIKTLNHMTSDDIEVGDGFAIPEDWDLDALGIRRPIDRPGRSLDGFPRIAATFATGRGLSDLQARIDAVSKTSFEGKPLSTDDVQFLSDFFHVLYTGAYALRFTKGPEPKMRLQYYFDAIEGKGEDLELRTGWSGGYSSVYADSAVVKRAQPIMKSMIAARVRGGELSGTLTSQDIKRGDPQNLKPAFTETKGRIRGQDWVPENKFQGTQRGHLMSEQGNFRLKYTDNNFVLTASWAAIPYPDGSVYATITWSVRDLYLFRSAAELRSLGFDPYMFHTDLPTAGGNLRVPDALLQMPEALGWARRYHSYNEWVEPALIPAPARE